ncbi:MAG: hypothetical protein FJ119_02735 [Deltaproteobacteria bacterium]|nr:hypothetical protein [Deltaproteobacteria bacterium]
MSKPDMFATAQREAWMGAELEQELTSLAVNGRVACAQAQQFAERHGIAMMDMRRFLDVLHLKVGSCQLGCF